ncbi:hypothetical protein DVK05_13240 [Halorubrum sp. Atlit-8R]|uniref:hypothetical protein n=1 Tax=unclassified Halorubrum TaxID=2642239 RepID=UPI000EF1FA84|nr:MULTISPECIES: hypothetical protein [unclassified Halorubrum]RLM63869.1 hypothetical protein DVK08_14985 [Halorubrum sp. Atlit-9R]RLM77248.1 hypothetical protein DVK05_13240 [Halorubrum sp. Atlit-8R]
MAATNQSSNEQKYSIEKDFGDLPPQKQRAVDLNITLTTDEVIKHVAEEADIDVDTVYLVRNHYAHAVEQRRRELREQIANSSYEPDNNGVDIDGLLDTLHKFQTLHNSDYDVDYKQAFEETMAAYAGEKA